MSEKKNVVSNDEIMKDKELDLEELEDVSGGSLKDVNFTNTGDISRDTRSKIKLKLDFN